MQEVLKKQLRSHFQTPFGYVIGAILLLVPGIYTVTWNLSGSIANFEYALSKSAWILMILMPLMTLRLSLSLHAQAPSDASSQKKFLPFLKRDINDNLALDKAGSSSFSRIVGTYLASLTVYLIPCLILMLIPLILQNAGDVYLPSAFNQILAFFLFCAALNAVSVLIAVCEDQPLLALLFSALAVVLAYFLMPASIFCPTSFSCMLLFTLILALIGFAVYRIGKNTLLSLIIVCVPEIIQVVFFLVKQDSFTDLAPVLMSRLSLFERFYTFTAGLMDLRTLFYYLSVAITALTAAVCAFSFRKNQKTDSEASFRPAVALIALAVAIAFNIVIARFTGSALLIDVSSTKLFTPSEQFSEEARSLEADTDVYWICEIGSEDDSVRSALSFLGAQNSKIHVKRLTTASKDFILKYVVEDVYDNSILVISGDKYRFIPFADLYGQDYSRYDQIGTYDLIFEFQDQMDHVLEYINGMSSTVIYSVSDHNAGTFSDYYNAILQKNDFTVKNFSLESGIPEDASIVLLNGLAEDLTDSETSVLNDYLSKGGRLMLFTSLSIYDDRLPNLCALMNTYGAELEPGFVFESAANAADSEKPYEFSPSILDHEITQTLINKHDLVYLTMAQGLTLTPADGIDQFPLLSSSADSFSKIDGYEAVTTVKEDGDIDGPFTMAAAFESIQNGSRVVWIPTTAVLRDDVNQASKGGDQRLVLGSLAWLVNDQTPHKTIPATLYNYGILRLNSNTVSRYGLLFAFGFPFLYLVIGLLVFFLYTHKRMVLSEAVQNEARRKENEEHAKKREEERQKKLAREEALRKIHEKEKQDRKNAKKRSYAPLMDLPVENEPAASDESESTQEQTKE